MSRSFHTTRKDVRQAYERAQEGDDLRVSEYHKLREEYFKKRRTKSHIKEERQLSDTVNAGFSIDTLPIEIEEKSESLHYPASEKDIRELLKRMPQGLIDGLNKISLTLGEFEQRSPEESFYAQPEEDPYVGRLGYEVFAEIYRGYCLGTYFLNKNEIKLYGYVFDPAIENRQLWDFYLRIHMLETFVHELAHHYDFANRVSRGRWRMDDRKKGEIYAETMAHQWVREYVIPYVLDAYPNESIQLNSWMKKTIGLVVDLNLLVGDCRATTKNDTIRISTFFKTSSAFEEFVQSTLSGKDGTVSRIRLAEELHFAEEYDIALQILDRVLKINPKNVDAIGLYGDIYEHLKKYNEAIDYAMQALQFDKRDIKAHRVLCDSYAGLKDWESALKWAFNGLDVADNRWEYYCFLQDQAKAEIELEKLKDAEQTLEEINELFTGRSLPRIVKILEKELDNKTKDGLDRSC